MLLIVYFFQVPIHIISITPYSLKYAGRVVSSMREHLNVNVNVYVYSLISPSVKQIS